MWRRSFLLLCHVKEILLTALPREGDPSACLCNLLNALPHEERRCSGSCCPKRGKRVSLEAFVRPRAAGMRAYSAWVHLSIQSCSSPGMMSLVTWYLVQTLATTSSYFIENDVSDLVRNFWDKFSTQTSASIGFFRIENDVSDLAWNFFDMDWIEHHLSTDRGLHVYVCVLDVCVLAPSCRKNKFSRVYVLMLLPAASLWWLQCPACSV